MNALVEFFETIPSSYRTVLILAGLTVFLILEKGIPLYKFKYQKINHSILNLSLTVMTLLINLIGAGIIFRATEYNLVNQFGFINVELMDTVPLFFKVIISIFILDFIGAWLVHMLEHKIKYMWIFHIVHHTDQTVDVTTGLRHHPIEAIFRLSFTVLAVMISGASIGIVMLYQTISAFSAHFSHANIRLSQNVERILSFIIVTPCFHRIHHHYKLPHTDHNYGNIFSIWDYIFGTLTKIDKIDKIKFGLDTHMEHAKINNVKNLLLIPFQKIKTP